MSESLFESNSVKYIQYWRLFVLQLSIKLPKIHSSKKNREFVCSTDTSFILLHLYHFNTYLLRQPSNWAASLCLFPIKNAWKYPTFPLTWARPHPYKRRPHKWMEACTKGRGEIAKPQSIFGFGALRESPPFKKWSAWKIDVCRQREGFFIIALIRSVRCRVLPLRREKSVFGRIIQLLIPLAQSEKQLFPTHRRQECASARLFLTESSQVLEGPIRWIFIGNISVNNNSTWVKPCDITTQLVFKIPDT